MDKIQLLYVENVITRKKKTLQQHVFFFIEIENLDYNKRIDVIWAGEDGIWQTLPAVFHSLQSDNKEYWQAQIDIKATVDQSLPGNIQFGLRYQVLNNEYWDNKNGRQYHSQADSGIKLVRQVIQPLAYNPRLLDKQKFVPVNIAVKSSQAINKVTIHWTLDNWQHTKKASCHYRRHYWDKNFLSNARNPNQYGVQIWQAWLRVGSAFRLQYSVCCETDTDVIWANNQGLNYTLARKPFKLMILNLHCYQEDNQDYKFSQIAKAINELDVDVVCLQEVAEFWNNGLGDWNSNAARIINDQLAVPYHIHTDWSHLGFDRYREGVAILSRYPMYHHEARYVSESHDPFSIHSRKVVMAEIDAPNMGPINVFSAHLSWWEDGFAYQFNQLRDWASDRQHPNIAATLLCGDFNVAVGSQGYQWVMANGQYEDQYLMANCSHRQEQNFRINDPYWQQYQSNDYRIDYVFMNKSSLLKATSANILFTDQDYGRVSDHSGYVLTFEPK